jgi:hypothetical protein
MSTKTSRSGSRFPAPPTGKGGKKGRKPIGPVKVGKDRNWGPIALFIAVGVVALGIIAVAAVAVLQTDSREWHEQAAEIEGIVNYREARPEILGAEHLSGPINYEVQPPVGGPHNSAWQNCQGLVYDEPIASEHAVHSLEHGAVWITYHPDLAESEVERLADRVDGRDFLFMSPFPGLDAPISLQAWGYQLKVDSAGDERIDQFMRALRVNASLEPGATCGGGVTTTGTVPIG